MKTAGKITLITLTAVAALAAGPTTTPSAQTPVEIAKRYTSRLSSGEGTKAIEETWDLDGMFDGIFGDAMTKVSAADRATMREQMLGLLKQVLASPAIIKAMASATYTNFKAENENGVKTSVTFDLTFDGKVIPNVLVFQKEPAGWKIVDAGNQNQHMVSAIKTEFAKQPDGTTPQQYVKAMTSGG